MDINEYIDKAHNNKITWFADEVERAYNIARITDVLNYKNYLGGVHKVLTREDIKYKEEEYVTRKIVIQEAKTILNFHNTYLLGKPLSLVGTELMVKEFEKVYRKGGYNDIDYMILDKMSKFGDGYEYVYSDKNKMPRSKVIHPADGYPVYCETGEYISFIEHWIVENVYYYNVYYENKVEEWTNDGGELYLIKECSNVTGLPIHYSSMSDEDEYFGTSVLKDMIPLLDEIEDLLSKMGDSIYTLSLNPILTVTGTAGESSVPADACGYIVELELGSEMNYVTAIMDYNTIKYYLDTLAQKLNMVALMPSIVGGNSNVANVSEVSLKLLYQLADVMAMLNEKAMLKGLNKRFEMFEKILLKNGIKFTDDEYVNVSFNYSRPQNMTELLDNLTKQYNMGAISIRSIIEKSPLTGDVAQELDRISQEVVKEVVVKDKDNKEVI